MAEAANPALETLKAGIRKFQHDVYPANSDAYHLAATTPQKPHTLLITCSDSRIDIETITSSRPGEIFIARNVGNLVPPFGDTGGSISAVIEYAIDALHVQHAVVCGHTDCGAMKALKAGPSHLEALPSVKSWLGNAAAARPVAVSLSSSSGPAGSSSDATQTDISLRTLTEQNVLLQLTHLQTHPSVRGAMARGTLTLSGWVYHIGNGDVLIYDPAQNGFISVREGASTDKVSPTTATHA